nr:hypothetical protein B11B22.50 [imported] - Neurospora crassa [Neurospora crassa]
MPSGFQALKNPSSPSLSLTRSVVLSHSNQSTARYEASLLTCPLTDAARQPFDDGTGKNPTSLNMSARRYTIDELKGLHQPNMPALAGPLPLAPWILVAQRPSHPPKRPNHRLTICPKVDPKTDSFETFDNFDFEMDAGLSSLSIAILPRWPPRPIHECHVTKFALLSLRLFIQPVPAREPPILSRGPQFIFSERVSTFSTCEMKRDCELDV